MSTNVRLIQVFLATPGDVTRERKIIARLVDEWNVTTGKQHRLHAEVVQFRTHTHPAAGDRAQAMINRQALKTADILVGIFWSRFGTPTGRADSGTEEEIRESLSAGKRVLLYFSDCPIPPSRMDKAQYAKVRAFKREYAGRGLYWEYKSLADFESDARRHLAQVLSEFGGPRQARPDEKRFCVAIGVVRRGKRVLMVRRRIPEADGRLAWQFPAGIIKPNLTAETCVVSEIRKETGVTCSVVRSLGQRVHPDTGVESHYFLCQYLDGRTRNLETEENAEVKWVDARTAPAYVTSDLHDGIVEALKEIQEEPSE